MIASRTSAPAFFAPNLTRWKNRSPQFKVADQIQFGRARLEKETYAPLLEAGAYGIPNNHPAYQYFPLYNRPGVVKIKNIKSLDPFNPDDPSVAYASEITIDLKGTLLEGKTIPGEHLGFFDISDAQKFPPEFKDRLRQQGDECRFSKAELEKLGETRLKKFTIASPSGGERGPDGKPDGTVKLIVRRVEIEGEDGPIKGPMTNYLVNLKPGDGLVLAAPIAHHFVGPTASTPAIFLGVGSSVSPYVGMLRNRFELEKGPYAETYLGIGHTRPEYEYEAKRFQEFAQEPENHFTYRPVYSKKPEKSGDIGRIQPLIQQKEDAKKVLGLLMKDEKSLLQKCWDWLTQTAVPKTHIYISGFYGFEPQIIEALKKAAHLNPWLGYTEKQVQKAINHAIEEERWHWEGDIRNDLAEGTQNY